MSPFYIGRFVNRPYADCFSIILSLFYTIFFTNQYPSDTLDFYIKILYYSYIELLYLHARRHGKAMCCPWQFNFITTIKGCDEDSTFSSGKLKANPGRCKPGKSTGKGNITSELWAERQLLSLSGVSPLEERHIICML